MTKRSKKQEVLEQGIQDAFDNVKKDISFLFDRIRSNELSALNQERETKSLKFAVRKLLREFKFSHKHGKLTGKIYPTLSGKVKAITEHLGLEFKVEEAKKIPTKVSVTKTTTKKVTKK